MSEDAIEISGVSKRFGATHAVRDLDLVVPRGSLCGFLGPNGAGKSTTIRMIMSIIYPDSGSIDVLGGSALAHKDQIGYLPEERGVYKKMRVAEFLRYIARLKGMPGGGLDKHIREWLERIELPDVEDKRCQELSKGMQQKVQFLAAIIHDPELIILDEPFSGLDPVNAELLNRLIRELHAEGRTLIFSTHVLFQAEQICNRIFLINKGRKILDASLEEIRAQFDPRTVIIECPDDAPTPPRSAGVRDITSRTDGPGWELHLDDTANAQDIMRSALSSTPATGVRVRQLSLEEVFIRVVRTDLGEDAASTAREELRNA